MKSESRLVAGLAIIQAGELLGVAEEKLDLEPLRVVIVDGVSWEFAVSREQHDVAWLVRLGAIDDHADANVALQRHTVDHARVEREVRGDFSHTCEARQIGEVDFAVISFRSPAPALCARVAIAQVGIDAQEADEVQVKRAHA